MDPVDWNNVTETNVDKLSEELEKLETVASAPMKKKRGRPAKPKTPDESKTPPPPPPALEEAISSEQLASLFHKSPPSTPRKSPATVKFESEEESDDKSLADRLDQEILLKIYESFFREPLASRHHKRKKAHDENTPKHILERDVKELQRSVGSSDPANDLGHGWAKMMSGMEQLGLFYDIPLWGLGAEAEKRSKDPEMTDTFRELLIKYPRLRKYMVMGGFPELRLLGISFYMAGAVAKQNIEELSKLKRPERPDSK